MAVRVPRLALTPGEPAGIGPDLLVRLAQETFPAELVAVSDPDLLQARARLLGLPLVLRPFAVGAEPRAHAPGELLCDPVPLEVPVRCGHGDPPRRPMCWRPWSGPLWAVCPIISRHW